MSWLQIRFNTSTKESERLEYGLEEFGACSVTLKDSKDQPIFEPGPGETPLWDAIEITALFESGFQTGPLIDWLGEHGIVPESIEIENLEDQNWQEKWMEDFEPICFGNRLWVVPTWISPPDPDAVNIMLDPGLAFGSGTHPTTALCLEWLDHNDLQGKTLIDYGCGSGILAIAAAKLGAKEIWALDNDPQALESCKMNAEQNGVLDRIRIISPEELSEDRLFDIIVANILVTPLLELKQRFLQITRPGGHIVMSGILTTQLSQITDEYNDSLENMGSETREDWARVAGKAVAP